MTAYGEVERELAVLLRRARAWNRDLATEVHRDLQPTAYALLSRIEEQVSLRAPGAARRVGGLGASRGRGRGAPAPPHGRAQRLVVTEEGRRRMTRAREGRRRVLREQLDRWPESDVATFAALLGRFNVQMDAVVDLGPRA